MNKEELCDELNKQLLKQWESGYRDGVDSCATMLDMMVAELLEHNQTDTAKLLANISNNFRKSNKCVD